MCGKAEEEEQGGGCPGMWPCCVFGAHMCRTRAVACLCDACANVCSKNNECAMCNVWPRAPEGSR